MIYEERDLHVCIDVKDTRIEGDTKWVFDGQKWYPLRINQKFTDKKTTADYTDTSINIFIRYWYRTIR